MKIRQTPHQGGASADSTKQTTKQVEVEGKSDKTVKGDVSNSEALSGVYMHDVIENDDKLNGTVVVEGNISVDNKSEKQEYAPDSSTVVGVELHSVGGNGEVQVSGNVKADATYQENKEENAVGVMTDTNANITVGGNVESSSKDASNGIQYAYTDYSAPDSSVNTQIKGSITSSTSGKESKASGIYIRDKSTDNTTVGGDIKADGNDAFGIAIINPDADIFGIGKTTTINVGGNVEANGAEEGTGIYIADNLKKVDITVNGDIKGSTNGIYIENNMSDDVKIKTGGTISSENGTAILVVTDTKKTISYIENKNLNYKTFDSDKLPEITAWKIESGNKDLVQAVVYDAVSDTAVTTNELNEQKQENKEESEKLKNSIISGINYIIKAGVTEDGKDTDNGTIELTGTSGTVKIGDNEYKTAHQGEKITINVKTVDGYKYSFTDGQGLLKTNEDGTYTLVIPEGGGVELKAVLEKIQQDENKDQDTDKDDVVIIPVTSSHSGSGSAKDNYKASGKYNNSDIYNNSGNLTKSGLGKWVQNSIGWKFEKADGNYVTGSWHETTWNGNIGWYHFDGLGYCQGGWYTDNDGQKYYLYNVHDGQFGYMYTGWKQIDGVWYYFNTTTADGKSQGSLLTNSITPDGYTVDANGAWMQ